MHKVFGIRHHGAGSSRNLVLSLQAYQPDVLLIECPSDAQHLVHYVSQDLLQPPVAIMIYNQQNLQEYAYYPFATFSPEWQALVYGASQGVEVRFFDLPQSYAFTAKERRKRPAYSVDPFAQMSQLAGYDDPEVWWDEYIEQQGPDISVFDAILEMLIAMRSKLGEEENINTLREAYMRTQIRLAQKEGFARIGVVCGAWHAPAIHDLAPFTAGSDKLQLRGLKRVSTKATWVPWSYNRIARHTGYGAGVVSPYWYEALFVDPERAVARWMSRASGILQEMGLDVSPAHTIEGARLAEMLTALRGKPAPGIQELFDAVSTVYCRGDDRLIQKLRIKLLEGESVGQVSEDIPMVPLRQDLDRAIKEARLTRDWRSQAQVDKHLDLRRPTQLKASRLLHTLVLLDIPWGTEQEPAHNPLGSFHEYWFLRWVPDYEIKIIEASIWGNTLAEATRNKVTQQLHEEAHFERLGLILYEVLHAHLPELIEPVSQKIKDLGNLSDDVLLLMKIVPPLIWSLRYGDTAQLDTASIRDLLHQVFPRVCLLLPKKVAQIADDLAQDYFATVMQVQQAVQLMDMAELQAQWTSAMQRISKGAVAHPLIKGYALRLMLSRSAELDHTFRRQLNYELSSLTDPFYPAHFLEGFLYGGGWLLIHRPVLYEVIDGWLQQLDEEAFHTFLPILRRTFSTFSPAEKKVLMQLISGPVNREEESSSLEIDTVLLPTLQKLLD